MLNYCFVTDEDLRDRNVLLALKLLQRVSTQHHFSSIQYKPEWLGRLTSIDLLHLPEH